MSEKMPRRKLAYLRLAVTARCNLRCLYCRPPDRDHETDVLSSEELVRFAILAARCGLHKVRLTGGEPLLRSDIVEIVRRLSSDEMIADLSLTTNGTMLTRLAPELREAGLRRVNIGLPALDPEVYRRVTRNGRVEDALAGLEAALEVGFSPVKINVVVVRGVNEDQAVPLAGLTRRLPLEVRFIEYMPFLEGSEHPRERLVPADEILAALGKLGPLEPLERPRGPATARLYRVAGHRGTIGLITPHTDPFCHSCNRVRLTAQGRLRACLIDGGERDVLGAIRAGLDLPTMERLLRWASEMKPALHSGVFAGCMHRIGG